MVHRRLFVIAAVAVGLCSAGSAQSGSLPAPWSIERSPFAVELHPAGTRLTTLGGRAPLTYTDTAGHEHALSRVLATRTVAGSTTVTLASPGTHATAELTLHRAAGRIDVAVSVKPRSGVQALRLTLAAPPSAHFVGTGQRLNFVDLRRTVLPLKVWNACGSAAPAPFFASTAGFGAYLVSDAVGRIAFPAAVDDTSFACDLSSPSCSVGPPVPAVRICVKAAAARLEVYAGPPLQTAADYVRRAGLPRAPWLPAFALMKWRDSVSGEAEFLDDIKELRSRGLPIGWLILDNPWEEGAGATNSGCFGTLTFDHSRYPDPGALVRRVHAAHIRFMLWIAPQLKKKGCPAPDYPDGFLTGDDEYSVRDLTNPAARADFVARLQKLAALGIDGFKADRGDETDLEKDTLYGGPGVALHNAYPRLYAQAVAAAMRPYRRHWASLFQSSTRGSTLDVPGFVGQDTQHTWNGLLAAVRMAQTASVAGEAMWGSDIGGYLGGAVTPELFARWAQFAATTPVFEVGGSGSTATFWQLGRGAVEQFRDAATLHYSLVPYLDELVRDASVSGVPVLRPLGLTWPSDNRAWAQETEYTVGNALLAAPVVTQAAADSGASVYLPAGTWIDYFTGERLRGGRTIVRGPATKGFPLYVRAGTALADNFRDPSVWRSAWRPDDLARAGRQGWVIAPARGRRATARSDATTLRATVDGSGRILVSFRGAEPWQQLRVHVPQPICGVHSGARRIARRSNGGTLRAAAEGWRPDGSRAATVVVKAHVGRSAELTLLPCS